MTDWGSPLPLLLQTAAANNTYIYNIKHLIIQLTWTHQQLSKQHGRGPSTKLAQAKK